MAVKERVRIGGRSARIQSAVHDAVRELGALTTRNQITVPQIAAEAGVTPSTIYRRWGDLQTLLADVAVARLRPIARSGRYRRGRKRSARLHRTVCRGDVVSGRSRLDRADVLSAGARTSPAMLRLHHRSSRHHHRARQGARRDAVRHGRGDRPRGGADHLSHPVQRSRTDAGLLPRLLARIYPPANKNHARPDERSASG